MTRNGKIARLPHYIRDELNRRIDNGEPGVRLVEWLNTLPEVQQVVQREFEAKPINEVNLTDWKNGGYLDWQAQQEARALVQDLKSDGIEFAKVPSAELVEPLTTAITAHYAAALYRTNIDTTEEPTARVKRLGKSLRDIDRLRRRALAAEQIDIQRQWLKLGQKVEDRKSKTRALGESSETSQESKISEEEKQRRLKEWIFPERLFPEKYQNGVLKEYLDEQTQGNDNQQTQNEEDRNDPS